MLREAIESILSQSFEDWEILIGDDSPDDESAELVSSLNLGDRVRYFHHRPGLRQAKNVQFLFEQALGKRLVLLHDDDLLVEGALQRLNAVWAQDPDADVAFGKQYSATEAGVIDHAGSETLNREYFRSDDRAGLQPSPAFSGLVAQIPNDGYMVRTELARAVGYRDDPSVGAACDYDFGLRLCLQNPRVYLVPEYTAVYRICEVSEGAKGSDCGYRSFYLAKSVDLPPELDGARKKLLHERASMAVHGHLDEGDRRSALRVFLSKDFPPRGRFRLGGLRIMYRLLRP